MYARRASRAGAREEEGGPLTAEEMEDLPDETPQGLPGECPPWSFRIQLPNGDQKIVDGDGVVMTQIGCMGVLRDNDFVALYANGAWLSVERTQGLGTGT